MSFDSGRGAYARPVRRDYEGTLERLVRVTVTDLVVLKDAVVSMFTAQQKLTVTDRAEVSSLTNVSGSQSYEGTRRSYGYVEWKTPVNVMVQPSAPYIYYDVPTGQGTGDDGTFNATKVSGLNAPTLVKSGGDITAFNPANGSLQCSLSGFWRIRYTIDFVRTGSEPDVIGAQVVFGTTGDPDPLLNYGLDYIVVERTIVPNQVYTVQGEYTGNMNTWAGSNLCIALQFGATISPVAVRVLETSILIEYISSESV